MLATIDDVLEIANVSVDNAELMRAQVIIETAAGRPEELVTRDSDKLWLKRAVAHQCAYMEGDAVTVFEQPNLVSTTQGDNKMVFGDKDVWLAPLAERAISRLSWMRSRTIATAPFNYRREIARQRRETRALRRRWYV